MIIQVLRATARVTEMLRLKNNHQAAQTNVGVLLCSDTHPCKKVWLFQAKKQVDLEKSVGKFYFKFNCLFPKTLSQIKIRYLCIRQNSF